MSLAWFGGAAGRLAVRFGVALAAGAWVSAATVEFLSQMPERFVITRQDWGELGLDVSAHAPGQTPLPLQLGDKRYERGLGHHANGEVVVELGGEFTAFDAELGVQRQPANAGSVVFRILVDGQPAFTSGVLRPNDPPHPVHVELRGAEELRLEAHDADDGITCDCADWADARLTRAANSAPRPVEPRVDVAPFGRLVTWDANRTDGARASRTQEFRAEDLFLETEVLPGKDGTCTVPVATNGLACLGLQWLNRRALRELGVHFADAMQAPSTTDVRVEGWVGESAWQGAWRPLQGELAAGPGELRFRLGLQPGLGGTPLFQKIRWVFPASAKQLKVRRLSAFTRSRWATLRLVAQVEAAHADAHGQVRISNGEFVEPVALSSGLGEPRAAGRSEHRPSAIRAAGSQRWASWDLSQPLHFAVRYSRAAAYASDPTVVLFRLPGGAFGVGLEDLLTNDCVYLPAYNFLVGREPLKTTLAARRQEISARRSVLEEVRRLPDQTLAQAMTRTHHEAQQNGPVLLSLAADNAKYVLERDGTLEFYPNRVSIDDWLQGAAQIIPRLGGRPPEKLRRHLEGDWLPIPVITHEQAGVRLTERAFVAPLADWDAARPPPLNLPSAGVLEFTLEGQAGPATPAEFTLGFLADARSKRPAPLRPEPGGWSLQVNGKTVGALTVDAPPGLTVEVTNHVLRLAGALNADRPARVVVWLTASGGRAAPRPDLTALRRRVETYWHAMLAPAAQIESPDPFLNALIRSSQVRCFIAARNEADGARIAPWIAAMHYGPLESESHAVLRGMDCLGHHDFVRRGLEFFVHRYDPAGFLTTGYTTFGTAWHIWTLGEHWRLTRDDAWLRGFAPQLTRVGKWTIRQTQKTKRWGPHGGVAPEYGLLPPGVLADWNSYAYHFAMNAYYYAALRELGTALGALGLPEARGFSREAAALRANVLRAYAWTQAQSPVLPLRTGAWTPHYPSQLHSPGKLGDFFPGQDAGRSWCYDVEVGAHQLAPAGVLDPRSPEVSRIMEHSEDVQFLASGWFDYPARQNQEDWFNLGGFSKVQPYYCRNAEIYALRDEIKPFLRSYFNTLAAMVNPEVLTFWEHFHSSGAWDKTHETGYFLHQTRCLFVLERGRELWLAPLITTNWLQDGMTIAVTNAPTRFGPVSFRLHSQVGAGFIEAEITPPHRPTPGAIVLRLRHPEAKPLRSVRLNGSRHHRFDPARETITLARPSGPLRLRARY